MEMVRAIWGAFVVSALIWLLVSFIVWGFAPLVWFRIPFGILALLLFVGWCGRTYKESNHDE